MKDTRTQNIRKIVLAYSGGLDTSVILHWIKKTYNCEVIAYCADIGQEEELTGLEEKAARTGASKCYVEDLRAEFVSEYVFPMLRASAVYEMRYLLGTSIARPLPVSQRTRCLASSSSACACSSLERSQVASMVPALAPRRSIRPPSGGRP